MLETLIIIIAAVVVFTLCWLVLSRFKKDKPSQGTYVCGTCGERHCDCHKHS